MTAMRPPVKREIKPNVRPVPKPLAEAVLAAFKAIWPDDEDQAKGKRTNGGKPVA